MVYTILVVLQVVVALSLVALILVQHGKGADAGAAFGSGASGTVFGAKGSANFMSHATAALAIVFFVASLTLAYLVNGASTGGGGSSVTDQLTQPSATESVIDNGASSRSNKPSADQKSSDDAGPSGNTDQGNQSDNNPGAKIPD